MANAGIVEQNHFTELGDVVEQQRISDVHSGPKVVEVEDWVAAVLAKLSVGQLDTVHFGIFGLDGLGQRYRGIDEGGRSSRTDNFASLEPSKVLVSKMV